VGNVKNWGLECRWIKRLVSGFKPIEYNTVNRTKGKASLPIVGQNPSANSNPVATPNSPVAVSHVQIDSQILHKLFLS